MGEGREADLAAGAGNSEILTSSTSNMKQSDLSPRAADRLPVGLYRFPRPTGGQVFKFQTLSAAFSFKPSHKGSLEFLGSKLFPELEPGRGRAQVHHFFVVVVMQPLIGKPCVLFPQIEMPPLASSFKHNYTCYTLFKNKDKMTDYLRML